MLTNNNIHPCGKKFRDSKLVGSHRSQQGLEVRGRSRAHAGGDFASLHAPVLGRQRQLAYIGSLNYGRQLIHTDLHADFLSCIGVLRIISCPGSLPVLAWGRLYHRQRYLTVLWENMGASGNSSHTPIHVNILRLSFKEHWLLLPYVYIY